LRTKRELWKTNTELSRIRHQARSLLALRQEVRDEKEPILMKSLARIGLVSSDATLDDVLNLNVDNLLSRRLQTIVSKKLGFKTPYQARQAVIHGHIMIGDRKIDIPSYTVRVEEEDNIHFAPESKIPEMLEKTKSEPEAVETPAVEGVDAPVKEAVDIHVEEKVKTPVEEEVKTPVEEEVKTPVEEEVKTPVEEETKDESSSTEQSKK